MGLLLENYTNIYPIQKTLQFRLNPMYETSEHIETYGIKSADKERAAQYLKVKPLMDRVHQTYMQQRLTGFSYDWTQLADALSDYQRGESAKKDWEKTKLVCKTLISSYLQGSNLEGKKDKAAAEMYGAVSTPNTIIKTAVYLLNEKLPNPKKMKCPNEGLKKMAEILFQTEEQQTLSQFDTFAAYFGGYEEARKNIYAKDKSTSVAYRLVDENFPKFIANLKILNALPKDLYAEFEKELTELLGEKMLKDVFEVQAYNNVLTQDGILFYNSVLGGKTEEDGNVVQGLNQLCNLAFQQKRLPRKVKFAPLYRQILSDKDTTLSFVIGEYKNDEELLTELFMYADYLSEQLNINEKELAGIFADEQMNISSVFVQKGQLTALSQILFDNDWSELGRRMRQAEIKEEEYIPLDKFQSICEQDIRAAVYERVKVSLDRIEAARESLKSYRDGGRIQSFDEMKSYLDTVQEAEKMLKIFAVEQEYDREMAFYSTFDVVYESLRKNVPVYNKVRNYATKKPYSTEKYRLIFEKGTLGDGWDQNKEYDNNVLLFRKDGNYYLGIINAKANGKLTKTKRISEQDTSSASSYQKMVYKFLPDPKKMLPKVFFSKKWLTEHPVSEYIQSGYNAGKHKKGKDFDILFCRNLIEYFKQCISIHPDWSKYNFVFSDTDTYEDINGFYREIETQNYKISFSYVEEKEIRELVRTGKLYFFHIYNKDFSSYSTGKKNLHTMYWLETFSELNLQNPKLKLNGGAELFFRPASIENPFAHEKDSVLIKKTDVNGDAVNDEKYQEAMECVSRGMSIEMLREKYPALIFRYAPHDIVKDRRYTRDQFSFHVPISFNYGTEDISKSLNQIVLNDISEDNSGINIIGIDRGERNLLYVSCIDAQGNILEQRSLNVINGVDYQKKLRGLENERDSQRKNWKRISAIKDVKAGYLSLAIHQIVDMMLRHNAILVLEDLNFGFKRGRFHIERQVYQKFEKMLIDKLNYLCLKDRNMDEPGSIRYGYQFTAKFESFKAMGKQTGLLFYVPASYTSKIDPRSGFVNLFTGDQLRYHSRETAREFFRTFDRIRYDEERDMFRFSFRYSSFKLKRSDFTDKWTVCTFGDDRIVHTKKDGRNTMRKVNVTAEMKELFENHGIALNSADLREQICAQDSKEFFKTLLWLFGAVVQLRYEDSENDFILSPIEVDGRFFDSRTAQAGEPCDGDANGAYHIALQGLRMLNRIEAGRIKPDEKNKQLYNWLKFTQSKHK